MSLEELLSINVISASRSFTNIIEAPSVMTVITADDISRQGLKTLEEVLQRVPGFFPSEESTRAVISNRGILTNKFLMLIDGHAVNSIVKNGFFQQHIYPLLDNVERIEVVRGPGSTLWGNEAALGVINIITKSDWDEINSEKYPHGRMSASYDYADNTDRQIAKLSYDRGFYDGNGLMLTGNWFRSDPKWMNRFVAGSENFIIGNGSPTVLRDFNNSYEMYGKLKVNSFLLSARTTNFESGVPFLSNTGINEEKRSGHFEYENSFIEARYNLEVGDTSEIDFIFSFDRIRDHVVQDLNGSYSFSRYIRSEEDGIGGETIYTTNYFEDHEIKTGIYYRYVDVIRLEEQRYFDDINRETSIRDQAKPGYDNTFAFFAEDTWHFADKWIAVYGGRIDYNDFREDATIFLPRAGLIWKTTDRVTLKYLYNTGYIRPYVQQSNGTAGEPFYYEPGDEYWVGADKSEKVSSHDFQVLYNHEGVYLGATFYYLTYKDFIEWPGVYFRRDPDYRAYFQNLDDITSKGVELEWKVNLFDPLTVYGNYSYSYARFDDLSITVQGIPIDLNGSSFVAANGAFFGVPEHTWNFGIYYDVNRDVDLNVHYRGWDDAWALESRLPTFRKFGPEHYVDLNLRWKNIFKIFNLSFYCKNLFDNTGTLQTHTSIIPAPAPEDISGTPTKTGVIPDYGRTIGLKVEFKY
jgi:iron complex outermembrane receptor protein